VIPTAIRVSAQLAVVESLLPALDHLRRTIEPRGRSLDRITKTAARHLMDAMPLTFAQEFGAVGRAQSSARERSSIAGKRLRRQPDRRNRDRHRHQRPIRASQAHGEDAHDALAHALRFGRRQVRRQRRAGRTRWNCPGPVNALAVALMKIPPRPALDETPSARRAWAKSNWPALHPAVRSAGQGQPGDPRSDLHGLRAGDGPARGDRHRRRRGNFQLNVMLPLIAANLLESIRCCRT
jgi:fumarate hydratase class II